MKENQWKNIFKAIPAPCLVLKPHSPDKFTIVDANPAYLQLVDKSYEDLVGRDVKDVFPPNPRINTYGYNIGVKSWKKILETGKKQCIRRLRYDVLSRTTGDFEARYFDSENIPLQNELGEVDYILHTPKEVFLPADYAAREKQIQEELLVNRQQYRNFINENPDGLYRLDLEGNFLHANDGLAKMAEIPLEKILQMSFHPFCAPDHRDIILANFEKVLKGRITSFEADYITGTGKRVPAQMLLMPMFVEGEVVEVHGIAKDITEIRETQKIVIEKSRFLEVNASFISSLLENEIDDQILKETFGAIAQTVEADRMYYFHSSRDEETGEILISQKVEWCSNRFKPQINNRDLQNLPIKKVKEITSALFQNSPFTATLGELSEGNLKEIFQQEDIQSMLLLPIFLEEELHGFIGFDDCKTERIWKMEEISFLRSLTQNLTSALEKKAALDKVQKREEELKKSEQKFRALVQEGSDLIGILDKDGYYSFVSENYKKILGYEPDELVSKNASKFIHPDDWKRVRKQFEELYEQKQVVICPFRFRNKDGKYRWIQTTATNLYNDASVNGIVANSRDITTVIEQAREIEHINERYQLAATATQDLIYDWSLENNEVTRFHRGVKELFGYTSEEMNKRHFWKKNIHPDDFPEEKMKLNLALANPDEKYIKSEYRFRRADGSYAKVEDKGYIIRDSSGKAIRLIGATSDISEITAKKEALKVANKRFKMAMKATNEMIWDWEICSDYVTRSKGYKSIFGYDNNEATSVHSFWLTKVVAEDQEKIKASLKKALDNPGKKKWKLEYRFLKADGKVAHVTDRGYILRNEQGKAIRMVGAVLDITDSKRLLRRVQRQNKVLKEIAWEQSHVVRAPLARIQGLLQLLEEEHFKEMSKEQVLHNIKTSANELDTIIRSIVGKTEEIDVEVVQ